MSEYRVRFHPGGDGFHFANSFVNHTPFLLPGTTETVSTNGRCGGMAFASLDYWHAGLPIPSLETRDFPERGVPPDSHPLSRYISDRLRDSLLAIGSSFNFISWSLASLNDTTRWTRENEIPRVIQNLDSGRPVVLGLIKYSVRGLGTIGDNHQVVAYGYKRGVTDTERQFYIYDNKYPDRESVLVWRWPGTWLEIEVRPGGEWVEREVWRGFFIQLYGPRRPPWMPIWYDWKRITIPGAQNADAPAAVASRGPNRLDVFVFHIRELHTITRENGQWGGRWGSLGAPPVGINTKLGPAAISWAGNRLDVFVSGEDRNIWWRSWEQGRGWSNWENIGSPPGGALSGPAVASRGVGRLDVFVQGTNGSLWTNLLEPGRRWPSWGMVSEGPPGGLDPNLRPWVGAVSWDSNRLDVFVLGYAGKDIWWISWGHDRPWSEFESIGSPPTKAISGPAVVSRRVSGNSWARLLDVFVLDTNGSLWTRANTPRYNEPGRRWWAWKELGLRGAGPLSLGPAAVAISPNGVGSERIHLVAVDGNGYRYVKSYGWST